MHILSKKTADQEVDKQCLNLLITISKQAFHAIEGFRLTNHIYYSNHNNIKTEKQRNTRKTT